MINFQELEKVAEFKNGELNWLEGRDINAVYVILVGDEYYIGSSHYTYLRIGQHLKQLLTGEHHSDKLQKKFEKEGSFNVYTLDRGIPKTQLYSKEQSYIMKYKPTLNILTPKEKPEKKFTKGGMFRIREALYEKGMTGKELAEKMGVTPQYISGIVRGADTASVEVLSKIAKALNVPLASLFSDYTSGTHVRCPKCNHEFDIDIKVKP